MASVNMRMAFSYASMDSANLDLAVANGFNWITTGWLGHSIEVENTHTDDLPVLFEHDRKIRRYRKSRYGQIRKQIRELREYHQQARERGLKIALFSYEPSVPCEFRQAYPEAFHPYPDALRGRLPELDRGWMMCIFDAQVQDWIADKVEETLRNVAPVDAWIYTLNETMWGTANIVTHVCENCYNKPRWQALRLMRDAMLRGAERVPWPVTVIHRMWGTQHPDLQFRSRKFLRKVRPLADPTFDNAMAEVYEPKRYLPSRDLPRFMQSLEIEQPAPWIMSKATWSDYLLHQPLNPWVGHSGSKVNEVFELSLEPCHQGLYGFIPVMLLKQFKRHLKYGLSRGIKGVVVTPIEGEANWELNLANIELGLRLLGNSQASLTRLLDEWLAERYGGKFPPWLVKALLNTEDIWAGLAAYNGVSAQVNFDAVYYPKYYLAGISKFYAWPMAFDAWPDGKERFDLSRAGMNRAIATWNRQVAAATRLREAVHNNLGKIPARGHVELTHFVDRLATVALYMSLRQKTLFTRMALELRKTKPTPAVIRMMERWESQIYHLLANDAEIRSFYQDDHPRCHAFKRDAWRYPDVTERDAFGDLGGAEETVIDGFLTEEEPGQSTEFHRRLWL